MRIENGESKKATVHKGDTSRDMQTPADKPGRSEPLDDTNEHDAISACNATADELIASRTFIDALNKENAALKERLDLEKQTTQLLTELDQTLKSESEALRTAVAAKNEALTAKDAVIASQDKLIETLKQKKSSPWKRIGDVLIGIGLGVLL